MRRLSLFIVFLTCGLMVFMDIPIVVGIFSGL
jgi:hypothetical protein